MNNTALVGWVEAPPNRGTIQLLWTCLLVIFTSVWTVLHLNVPSSADSRQAILLRKLCWAGAALLAPDMVTLNSAAQWRSANNSVEKMHALGCKNWTLEHAFYADSGGFHLESSDYPSFPVNAASMHYLVQQGYISCPTISKEEIWDKSKADIFAKGLTLVQSCWLILQSVSRVAQGLAISQLELFTIAFVTSTIMSYFFWLHKPQGVGVPTILFFQDSGKTVATVLREAGPLGADPFVDTPLDFIEKPPQSWKRRQAMQHFGLPDRPLRRIPDDAICPANLSTWDCVAVIVPSMLHSTIHLMGWNFTYPTLLEKYLWRASSLVLAAGLFACFAVEYGLRLVGFRGHRSLAGFWIQPEMRENGWRHQVIDAWMVFVTCCLILARLYIIGEVLASLRCLPRSVFEAVNWAAFIPHV